MMKSILAATALSLSMSTAWAGPIPASEPNQAASTKLVQADEHKDQADKHKDQADEHKDKDRSEGKKYHYGDRDWGHRYSSRPDDWETQGCVGAGPVWYCP
jgi:Ni/Co efflux regulator RcnB